MVDLEKSKVWDSLTIKMQKHEVDVAWNMDAEWKKLRAAEMEFEKK